MNIHNLEYWHPVTDMYYKFHNDEYMFKAHNNKWVRSGMCKGFVKVSKKSEIAGPINAMAEKLRMEYRKLMWNRDSKVLIEAAELLENLRL